MEDELIWCDTKEKLKKVAQKLKSDGFSIADTETIWKSYGEGSVLSVHTKEKCITYCSRDWYKKRDYDTPITADEFLGKGKNPSIVIFRRDRNVIAKNVATGDEEIAKCSPNDEFCFKTGASIALARLMAKTPEVLNHDVKDEWIKVLGLTPVEKKVYTDADRNFKVGDYVTLKEGIEANKEYGGLPLLSGAMYDNAHNKRVKVIRADWSDDSNTYFYECKGDSQFTFHYSEEMLDKWDENKIREGDKVRIKKGCTGMRYDSYHDWVKEYISDPNLLLAFEREDHIDRSVDFEVVKIAPHETQSKTLAYIKYEGTFRTLCYLFDIEALEKV